MISFPTANIQFILLSTIPNYNIFVLQGLKNILQRITKQNHKDNKTDS